MNRLRRWLGGGVALVILGSCVAPSPPAGPAAAPEPGPAPTPSMPPRPADFVLAGSLIQGGIVIGTAPAGAVALTLDGAAVPIAGDGRFLIGFDRDAAPSAQLTAVLDGGRRITRALAVAPRAWNISRLGSLPKYPVPLPQFERLRPAELAAIAAARRIATDAAGWRQPLLWPATGRISTLFGAQRIYRNDEAGSYHSGIDIAVPTGTPVRAPADGVVVLASDRPFLLEGNLLMIDHGMGLGSAFMHLSRIVVTVGAGVTRGEVIAYSGATGRVTGPHLHWGLRWRNAKVDPLLVAGAMPAAR
ncbi:M23 family metallopeptidase [uncultured Sphingomonas sp.]|uniref:M23 family metallopeptidase n=1 Tax=uncultured Sphingomonas sp. TaxID=158754 RepID=UPI0035C9436B